MPRRASVASSRAPGAAAPERPPALRIGWVERVSLPDLGLWGLAAKVDTGARTSALHVSAVEDGAAAVHHEGARVLSLVLPPIAPRAGKRIVRVAVRDWVEVRDTSGRLERRPMIETTLEIGPLRRVIRLCLTDRGDMRYPMLVGRTALAPGILVDPGARFVLARETAVPPAAGPGTAVSAPARRSRRKQEEI